MTWLLAIHIAAMLAAFAFLQGSGFVLKVILARADVNVGQAVAGHIRPVFTIGKISVVLGIITGLILAAPYGYGRAWLIGAYALAVCAALLGTLIEEPWVNRLASASAANYASIRDARLPQIGTLLGMLAWAGLVWLMVAKPT